MTEDPTWTAVDAYYTGLFVGQDPALDAALSASDRRQRSITVCGIHGARDISYAAIASS